MHILIDDDQLIHLSWKIFFKKNKMELGTFFSVDKFLQHCDDLSKDVPIYIDSNLQDGIKGELESKKIYEAGFSNLFLCTGYEKGDIEKPVWIKSIIGKSPELCFKS